MPGKVLSDLVELKKHGVIHEIVVVNDGSTDGSRRIIESFSPEIHNVRLNRNMGKGFAFYVCANRAKKLGATVLAMADSDLEGVSKEQISALLAPLINPKTRMSIAPATKIM